MSAVSIQFRGVSKIYAGADTPAVDNLSLDVEEGETLCLIGTSGSGKSTVIKMINRLEDPSEGVVCIDGRDVRELDPIPLRRRTGYVIQSGGLFPHMSVAANIGLLCQLEDWDRKAIERRVAELLERVNLPLEFAARLPSELSGGERQRVGVARALALDPPTILMDEPFGALDPITRNQLHSEFLQLRKSVAKTIIVVTHDMGEAFLLGDRVALMSAGRLVQVGNERQLREQPANDFVARFLNGSADSSSVVV